MSTHLDPTLQTALTADAPLVFFAIEILYPAFNLRLVDGSGQVTINGNTFVGYDATYGAMAPPDAFSDGVSAEAPHLNFQLFPPSNTAAAALASGLAQGSPVTLYFGAINRATGAVIGTPYVAWLGFLDVGTLVADRGIRAVKIDAESAWDRFFDVDEGILLSDASHQAIWPGELGLEYVTEVQTQLPWGTDGPRPVVVHDVIGGSPDYSNIPGYGQGGGYGGHGYGGGGYGLGF